MSVLVRDDSDHSERSNNSPDASRDRETVARIRSGEEHAFDALYLEHAVALWRFAARITGSDEDAEEVVHDVFASIWAQRETWVVQGTIVAYLYRAVRNRAIDVVRHDKVIHRLEGGEDSGVGPPGMGRPPIAPDEQVFQHALQHALHDVLATLPERRRTALAMRYVQGMSYAEIAVVLDVSENAAFMLVARTREALRPVFERFAGE